jgi:hypothetical protein
LFSGTFFRELLQNYNSIPGRIQSWFICICAHWNLGVLLLADLIHHIDENALGLPSPSQSRNNCKWVMRIRERSAKELSDLARVTAPDNTASIVPTLSEFHHAINQCMILTEPWTVILIRAFSKAANYWMGEVNELLQVDKAGEELEERLGRGEECIRILWILGKKSDIARRCAETLSRAKTRLPV